MNSERERLVFQRNLNIIYTISVIVTVALLIVSGFFILYNKQKEEVRDLAISNYKELISNYSYNEVSYEQDIDYLEDQLNQLMGDGYLFMEIELWRLKDILDKSKVDSNGYVEREYNCVDYTIELMRDLRNEGYYACEAYLEWEDGAHSMVAIKTDEGLKFVEPQDDKIMDPLLPGDKYWDDKLEKTRTCFEYD